MSKTTEKQIAQLENEIQSSLEALKEASFIADGIKISSR